MPRGVRAHLLSPLMTGGPRRFLTRLGTEEDPLTSPASHQIRRSFEARPTSRWRQFRQWRHGERQRGEDNVALFEVLGGDETSPANPRRVHGHLDPEWLQPRVQAAQSPGVVIVQHKPTRSISRRSKRREVTHLLEYSTTCIPPHSKYL